MNNIASSEATKPTRFYTKQIAGLALFLRLLVVTLTVCHIKPWWFFGQATELGQLAQSVASGHGLSSPFGGSTGPSAFLSPGYPLLVSLLFKLFGTYSLTSAAALMALQAGFGAVTVLVLMHLTRRVFGTRTANIAGFLCAVNPWLICFSFLFWETSFSMLMLTLLVWLAFLWNDRPTLQVSLCTAAVAALGITVNPSVTLTILALFFWSVLRHKVIPRSHVFTSIALFLILASIWPVRNLRVMHAFIPMRDNFGYELWQGNRVGADGFFSSDLHPNVNHAEFARFNALGELSYMHEKSAIAHAAIQLNPLRFAALTAKRALCFWTGTGRAHALDQMFMAVTTSCLGLVGLVMLVRRRGLSPAMPFILTFALFPLPYYITHPDFRFWCVLAPILTALAANAIAPLIARGISSGSASAQ